ncbi:flagellar basal body FlgE domain-containing protein [Achromobacter xylosoxidans]
MGEISTAGLTTSPANSTSRIRFNGYLSSTGTDHQLNAVKVYDRSGAEHLLKVSFVNTGATRPGTWKVTIEDGPNKLGRARWPSRTAGSIRPRPGSPSSTACPRWRRSRSSWISARA